MVPRIPGIILYAFSTQNAHDSHARHTKTKAHERQQQQHNTPTRFTQPSHHHPAPPHNERDRSWRPLHPHPPRTDRAPRPTPYTSKSITTVRTVVTTTTYQHIMDSGVQFVSSRACIFAGAWRFCYTYGAAVDRVDRLHPSCRCFFLYHTWCGTAVSPRDNNKLLDMHLFFYNCYVPRTAAMHARFACMRSPSRCARAACLRTSPLAL